MPNHQLNRRLGPGFGKYVLKVRSHGVVTDAEVFCDINAVGAGGYDEVVDFALPWRQGLVGSAAVACLHLVIISHAFSVDRLTRCLPQRSQVLVEAISSSLRSTIQ